MLKSSKSISGNRSVNNPFYPWMIEDKETYPWGKEELSSVLYHLRGMFDMKRLSYLPAPAMKIAVEAIVPILLERKWVLVMASSPTFLQAFADYCAVSFSLTTLDSCRVVQVEAVERMFVGGGYPYPNQECDDLFVPVGLLEITGVVEGQQVSSPRVRNTLGSLLNSGPGTAVSGTAMARATMVAVVTQQRMGQFSTKAVEQVFNQIEATFGSGIRAKMKELCVVRNLEIPEKPMDVYSLKLPE